MSLLRGNAAWISSTPHWGLASGCRSARWRRFSAESIPICWSRCSTSPGLASPSLLKRPGQHGGAERQRVTALAHRSGVPYVPSLAVAVHLALHQGLFCHSRNPWSDELAAQNFSVVRMPVFLLCHGQRLEEPLGNDVFDSVQIRALTVGPNGELRCKSLAPTSSNRVFADLSSPSGVLSCCAWLATPNPTNKARTATALIPTARSDVLERLMTGLLLKRRIDCHI